MTIHARFLPKYPKRINVNDGLTKTEANGVVTLGFDYENSEFGAELQQAVDATSADAQQTAADKIAAQDAKAAAESAADEAESWAGIAETAVVNVEASYSIMSDAEAATIGATKKSLILQGRTAIGVGGARYKRVDTEPSHAGKFRSTDRFLSDGSTDNTNGGWWEIAESVIDVRMLGMAFGANADDELADAIGVAEHFGAPIYIPTGSYKFLKVVDLSPLLDGAAQIVLGGDVTFDFSSATDNTDFPGDTYILIDAGTLTSVGGLSANVSALDRAFTISTPSLSPAVGDILCIYNPNDGSYNAARTYYRAGEFVRVARYDTGEVTVAGGLVDAYTAGSVDIYKHPAKRLSINGGRIYIEESTDTDFNDFASMTVVRLVDSDLSAFVPRNPAYCGHLYNQVVGLYGVGYHVEQNRAVSSDNYGLVFANCQDCVIEGYFTAAKHAVTAGGNSGAGCVPNTNIRVNGTFLNIGPASPGSGVVAVNFHGNVRNSYYGGYIGGSASMGGNYNGLLPGTVVQARSDSLGIAILLTDIVGHDFDFRNLTIRAAGDPGAVNQATIAMGADTLAATSNTKLGGTIRLDGTTIDAPASSRPITYQNRGYVGTGKVRLSLRGVTLRESTASPIIVVATVTGKDIEYLDLDGFLNLAGATYSVAGVDYIRGWRASGKLNLSPSTSASVVTNSATINAPKTPNVTAICPVTVGGSRSYPYIGTISATSVEVGAATCGGSTFASSSTSIVHWTATIDD